MCFVFDPASVHGPKTKHTKLLPQADERRCINSKLTVQFSFGTHYPRYLDYYTGSSDRPLGGRAIFELSCPRPACNRPVIQKPGSHLNSNSLAGNRPSWYSLKREFLKDSRDIFSSPVRCLVGLKAFCTIYQIAYRDSRRARSNNNQRPEVY